MKMHIYLKGGGDFVIEVTEFDVEKGFTGEVRSMNWTYPEKHKRRMTFLDPSQVAAIVRED